MSLQKSGYTEKIVDGRHFVRKNGITIGTMLGHNNKFGHYVVSDILYNAGKQVLKHTGENINFGLTDKSYNSIDLDWYTKCINITKANYNKLLAGEVVDGYTKYNPKAVYNIVNSVQNASIITYSRTSDTFIFDNVVWHNLEDTLYNNVVGLNTEYTVDTQNNVDLDDSPYCDVRYFDPVITNGDKILLTIRVDDFYQSALKTQHIDESFTIIIKTQDGAVSKRTVYAGIVEIETPAFSSTEGEGRRTWFTVQCIDSRGVESALQCLAVYVRTSEYVANYKRIEDSHLSTYGIIPDVDNRRIAYNNKLGFTDLFAAVKQQGFNGVILPKHTYYLSPHKNINSSRTLVAEGNEAYLGEQKYYFGTVGDNHKFTAQPEELTITQVTNDVKQIHRYGSSYPDFSDEIIIKGGQYWKRLSSSVTSTLRYLRTRKLNNNANPLDVFTSNADVKVDNNTYFNARSYYFVVNTALEGDYLIFPDNFTVDLNESTIQCVSHYDLYKGGIICFVDNVDTTIKNGTIKGCFETYNFWNACLAQASTGDPTETLANIRHTRSHFCNYVNLDISGAVGYDFVAGNGTNLFEQGATGLQTFTSNRCVDFYSNTPGSVIEKNGMVTSNLYAIPNTTKDYITVTRYAYKVWEYSGTRKELLISFYDENEDYIGYIKTRNCYLVPYPATAKYIRVSGYGKVISSTSQGNSADWCYGTGTGTLCVASINMDEGHRIDHCYMHDSRSVAIGVFESKQCCITDCTFTRSANKTMLHNENNSWTSITPVTIDFESGEQLIKYNTIKNCSILPSSEAVWSNGFTIHNVEFFNFTNNTNFNIEVRHGITSGVIKNNTIGNFKINRSNYPVQSPIVEYSDNIIGYLDIAIQKDREGYEPADLRMFIKNSEFPTVGLNGLKLRNTIMDGYIYID